MRIAEPLLCLASGVLPEHPAETVATAAALSGWPAFGVRIAPEDWSAARARELKRRADDSGLIILDAEVVWITEAPLSCDHFKLIDVAASLEARNLLVVSSDPDEAATVEKFARICAYAEPTGIPVSLEFGRFTKVADIHAACRIIAAAGQSNARVLVDALHWSRSGGTLAELAAVPRHLLSYAQFCDAVAEAPDPENFEAIRAEALDGRCLPGAGALPLASWLAALPQGLPLSVELRSAACRAAFPDPVARAAHVLQTTRGWFAAQAQKASRA